MAENPDVFAFATDEMVVDSGLATRVLDELDALNVVVGHVETNDTLQLTRLSGLLDARGPITELDGLVIEVRRGLGSAGAGDLLGKNRLVIAHVGTQGTKPMGTKPMGTEPMGTKPMGTKPMSGEPVPVDTLVPLGPRDVGGGVRIHVVDVAADPDGPAPHLRPARAGHSRFVTSLIRQQAPDAGVTLVPVFDLATGQATLWDTATAIAAALPDQPHLLNLSLGCFTADGKPPFVLARAVDVAAKQALLVAAAGNHGDVVGWVGDRTRRSPCFPAALDSVLAVGTADDLLDPDERFSPRESWVGCTAPGVDLVAAYLDGTVQLRGGPTTFTGVALWRGTSFSTAIVTGRLAGHLSTPPTVPTPPLTPDDALRLLDQESDIAIHPFAPAASVAG